MEWSSDYLMVGAGGTVEMVSIKHREPDQPAWTPSALCPVLIDLHGYWRAMDERCECVFASSIGVTGKVTERASALLDGAVPEPEAARFWQALRLPDATTVLPRRNEITRAGTGLFLVHEPVLVDTAPDGGSVRRRAKARQLEPAGRDVWLTQTGLRQDTPTGRARLRALRREADLLADLSTTIGVPCLVDFQAGDVSAALVTEQPGSRPLVDVFGPPGPPYPGFVLDAVLRGCATLVQALTALHARQHAHRALAPHALLVTARGGVVLRDLGLATGDHRQLPPFVDDEVQEWLTAERPTVATGSTRGGSQAC